MTYAASPISATWWIHLQYEPQFSAFPTGYWGVEKLSKFLSLIASGQKGVGIITGWP